ncbi:16S rRNA (uracil(1498)-N(3))-methyltransferase [Streptomyces synnematoformans]|uniref:Ribosomal RNA small subunit methyltransferase E n=1 Tax=Streptomyces synnematoformans TaxID=415721 RepID=A0ABN2XSH1_9ACTN
MTAPVFVAEPDLLADARPGAVLALTGPEGRHAVSVRRLRAGEDVVLTDGAGRGAYGTVTGVTGPDRLLVTCAEVREEPAPRPRLTVVQALPKGDRGELAVETMTETGVDAVVPWAASRCVTQWRAERGRKSLAKWRATAREAGKQARRLRFPEVAGLHSTKELLPLLAGAAFAAVLHEEGEESTAPLAGAALPRTGEVVLVVGPEGGVTPAELAAFEGAGAGAYRLGPTVLRTSTAGTAAGAVVLAATGRWS